MNFHPTKLRSWLPTQAIREWLLALYSQEKNTSSTKNHIQSLKDGFEGAKSGVMTIIFFSVIVNLLALTGPVYMLQIYDRVLTSRSEETLLTLTILAGFLFVFMGLLDYLRTSIGTRMGATAQSRFDQPVFQEMVRRSASHDGRSRPTSSLKDLEIVQQFISSPVLFAICDMPWLPLFIAIIYLFHPWLGLLALFGGMTLVVLSLVGQLRSRKLQAEVNVARMASDGFAESVRENGEIVQALGMSKSVTSRWNELRHSALTLQLRLSERTSRYATTSKTSRFFLQSAMLGLGAFLVIKGEITAGVMIACSILLGRALAPVDQVTRGLSSVQNFLQARKRINSLLANISKPVKILELPRPRGHLTLENLTVVPPESKVATLRMLNLEVKPGQVLGVIGPSGSGKSTLARALTGIWKPYAGSIRVDGSTLAAYGDTFGQYVGYVPQETTFFGGTIADNISRLDEEPDDKEIIRAAERAGVHEMITEFEAGYNTPAAILSGGQKQRIGLARAFYGDPVLLVLDEPNSDLDSAGLQALNEAIKAAKEAGMTIVIMTHRPSGNELWDMILVLEGGRTRALGTREKILETHVKNHQTIRKSETGKSKGGNENKLTVVSTE